MNNPKSKEQRYRHQLSILINKGVPNTIAAKGAIRTLDKIREGERVLFNLRRALQRVQGIQSSILRLIKNNRIDDEEDPIIEISEETVRECARFVRTSNQLVDELQEQILSEFNL